MSTIALLMGLLVLSFVGSLLVGSRDQAARGLPSGIEYLGLGFAVGPSALGLVDRRMLGDFDPIVEVALGWLAFVIGLDFGRVDGRRVRGPATVFGVAVAGLTGVLVAAVVLRAVPLLDVALPDEASTLALAGGAGVIAAETTRAAVQWVAGRWGARGAMTDVLVEVSSADDFAPLVAAGAIFAAVPAAGGATIPLGAAGWFAISLGLGALLGTVTALLLRGAEGYAVWGALFGTLLLGVGTSSRFGLCTIFVTFVMGVALAALAPARRVLRRMVGSTERAVLYPMLLLAGARLDPHALAESTGLIALVAVVLLARVAAKIASGFLLRATVPAARPAGFPVGVVLLASGPVTMLCGFAFALRFPGPVGDTLLVCAAASNVLGEIVSTFAIKRLLDDVGELGEAGA